MIQSGHSPSEVYVNIGQYLAAAKGCYVGLDFRAGHKFRAGCDFRAGLEKMDFLTE